MTKDSPLVSVVITNYNYGQYIREALDSVLAQTYKNIELIVIDDGSTDDSIEIIDEYKKVHPGIKVVKQKNQGVVPTRNKGLKLVSGEYMIFIDADDTVPNDFIEIMYNTAVSTNADIVYCDLHLSEKLAGTIEVKAPSLESFIDFPPMPICQLIRRSVIGEIKFDEHLNKLAHEDNDFFLNLFLKGASFAKADTWYEYRVHGSGRSPIDHNTKHYAARLYIYEKYEGARPELTDITASVLSKKDMQIDKWHKVADERLKLINANDDTIRALDKTQNELQSKLSAIINSKSYRIGKAITAPISTVKKALKEK